MDTTKITQLAQLLRDSGDKVLNERYKLTLSVQLLQSLSAAFRLIVDDSTVAAAAASVDGRDSDDAVSALLRQHSAGKSSALQPLGDGDAHFRVLGRCHNARTAEMCDLQLIYDFVQKTRILCVTHFAAAAAADAQQQSVDITKFRNLRRLEISKLPVGRVRGIQKLRAHLQELKCVQSIDSVEEIISHCGGDRATGFAWNELHTVDFSYNRLRKVDSSLEFVTALQYLNLSHNNIDSVDAIKWLKNLKHLNLSYNRLAFVPTLNVEAPRRLRVLMLASNLIEDMQGLSRLEALTELDLSDNFLLDHLALMPLSTLVALQLLNLSGNPLACLPKHRVATARFLHRNAGTPTARFQLDGEPLSKAERALTGQQQSHVMRVPGARQPFFSLRSGSAAASVSRPSPSASTLTLPTADNTPASSVCGSLRSVRMDDSMTSASASVNLLADTWTVQRRLRPKAVAIAEHPPGTEPETLVVAPRLLGGRQRAGRQLASLANTEHLETRKHIEEMRQLHGDSWLLVQQQHKNGGSGGGTGGRSASAAAASPLPMTIDQLTSAQTSTPNAGAGAQTSAADLSADASEYATALEQTIDGNDNDDDDLGVKPLQQLDTDATPVTTVTLLADVFPPAANDEAEEPPSDPEPDETAYIVNDVPTLADLFLVVSAGALREKDALTGRTQTRWPMSQLESCERTRADVLRLHFDTLQRDRRERVYRVEQAQCQQLERYLRALLAERPLSEMNQRVWRCVKCGVQFSRERRANAAATGRRAAAAAEQPRCPQCGSGFLVEMHESPTTAVATPVADTTPAAVQMMQPAAIVNDDDRTTGPIAVGLRSSDSQSSIAAKGGGASAVLVQRTAPTTTTTTIEPPPPSNPNPMPLRTAQSLNGSSSCSRLSAASSLDSNRSDSQLAQSHTQTLAAQRQQTNETLLAANDRRPQTLRSSGHQHSSHAMRRQHEFADSGSLGSEVGILSNPSLSSIEVLSSEYSASSGASRKPSDDGSANMRRDVARLVGGQSAAAADADAATDPTSIAVTLDAVAEQINRLSVHSNNETLSLVANGSLDLTQQRHNQQTSTRDLLELVRNSEPTAAAATTTTPPSMHPTKSVTHPHAAAALLLTESSSSGSVTDSICTAYDQQQRTIASNSMVGSIHNVVADNVDKVAAAESSSSMISSMLGGLFQSTNSLLAGKQRSVAAAASNGNNGSAASPAQTPTKAPTTPSSEPFRWSYTDFGQVDHRLKLHLYQTVFEDDNEQLKWLVRGQLLLPPSAAAAASGKWTATAHRGGGPAVWMMSTTKFYALQIVGDESDDVSLWLRRRLSGTIDRLRSVRVLPWKCGLTVDIAGIDGAVQLLLQDVSRTDSLLLFLADNPLPDTCQLHYQPAEWLLEQLQATTAGAPLKWMSILNECSVNPPTPLSESNHKTVAATNGDRLPALIVTDDCLYLIAPAAQWLISGGGDEAADAAAAAAADTTAIEAAAEPSTDATLLPTVAFAGLPVRCQPQQMQNLVAAEPLSERCVRFVYLDEVHDRQTEWTCTFATAAAAGATLDAVGHSWERLFGVPLAEQQTVGASS